LTLMYATHKKLRVSQINVKCDLVKLENFF
jgi:hypothetical protein